MYHRLLSACVCSVLVACSNDSAPDTLAMDHIRVGMTQSQLAMLEPHVAFSPSNDTCAETSLRGGKLKVLFENGTLRRLTITDPYYRTSHGIHIGSTEAEAIHAYGSLLVMHPHKYDPHGHYLSAINARGEGTVLETDGARVIAIRLGVEPALNYVEGCL